MLSIWLHIYIYIYVCVGVCVCAKSLQSHLFTTFWTVARQASLSMGFSRQECWSGLSCPTCHLLTCMCVQSFSRVWPHGQKPARLLSPWDYLGKNTWVLLLQGIFLTQGSNLCFLHLLHWQGDVLLLNHLGCLYTHIHTHTHIYVCMKSESEICSVMSDSLRPFGLYNPWNSLRQKVGVGSLSLLQGLLAGGFFTNWANREAHIGGYPGGWVVKNLPINAGDCVFNPWVRKIPWRRKQQPTPAFLSGESHRQGSLVG